MPGLLDEGNQLSDLLKEYYKGYEPMSDAQREAILMALRNTAQSASNSAASNISGPVNLIAMLLRKAGMPIPQDPVGGSEWMRQYGLTKQVPEGAANVIGETMGLVAPLGIAAKWPMKSMTDKMKDYK